MIVDQQFQASVKVMRSYDYCHFEVALSTDEPVDLDGVNELRKRAALLVDEAVRQYRIAKEKERGRDSVEYRVSPMIERIARLKAKPVDELTPEEAALLRQSAERQFWADYEQDDYCYQDDPERDHHFSMLRKFQETVVRG